MEIWPTAIEEQPFRCERCGCEITSRMQIHKTLDVRYFSVEACSICFARLKKYHAARAKRQERGK